MNIIKFIKGSKLVSMLRKPYRKIFRRLEDNGFTSSHQWWFMRSSLGVIHIGANTGQESGTYNLLNKRVIWVEPIPEVFEVLTENIRNRPKQTAVQALLSDTDGNLVNFNVSSNNGLSSSILELGSHKDIYPHVSYTKVLQLVTITLDSFIRNKKVDLSLYDTLVLDVQGAELLVLKGGILSLNRIRWIYLECADFEIYKGCCTKDEISDFLIKQGFIEEKVFTKENRPDLGKCYDILFKKVK